jgi:hypothetical protein
VAAGAGYGGKSLAQALAFSHKPEGRFRALTV